MTTTTKKLTLREYFEQVYVPGRHARETWKSEAKYRITVERFERFTGGPIPIGDITEHTIENFGFSILASGVKPETAEIYQTWIHIIMREADPDRFEKPPVIRVRKWPDRPESLRVIYQTTLRKQLQERGVSISQQHAMGTAVNCLCNFLEKDVTVEEVTPETVELFALHTAKRYKEKLARELVASVKRIVRMLKPEAFPKKNRRGNLISRVEHPWPDAVEDAEVEGTLAYAYAKHFWPARMQQRNISTIRQYRKTLWNFQLMLGRTPLLSDLTDENAGLFLARELASGLSPYTVNQRRNNLLAFWRFSAKKRMADEFPEVEPLAEPEIIPRAWTRRELSELFQSMKQQPGEVAGIPAGRWWLALHYVLWDTGERIGPLLMAEWEYVDLDTGDFEVPAQHRKGRRKAMLYRLKPATLAALQEIRKPNRKLIFPWPLTISMYYHRYDEILIRAGLPTGRRNKTHKMRRTFASHVEAAGGNATDAMRHSSRELTEKSYLDPRIVRREPANKLLFDIPLDDTESDAKGGEA